MYFKPSYLPSNGAANILVRELTRELGLSPIKKYQIILASFLAVAKKVNGKAFDWSIDDNKKSSRIWSLFPDVNNQSVEEVYRLLKKFGYIKAITSFTASVIESVVFGKPNWIKAQNLPKYFLEEATFIEANLPFVLVNQSETYDDKIANENDYISAPKLGVTQLKQKFSGDYALACEQVSEMNNYWSEYPLYNPLTKEFYCSAKRIFYNGSLRSGGQWYGGWTEFNSAQRCNFTINNHPVVQVDVNAMILCLLSSLTGKPMNMIGTFHDVYEPVVFQIPDIANSRDKVKRVIMELAGSGNAFKENPFPESEILDDVSEFIRIRDICLQTYPALKFLDNKRFNFTNDLSYHEAYILTETILRLKEIDVVAYPVHDTVIVRLGNEFDAVETLKRTFRDYVSSFQKSNQLPEFHLDLALTVHLSPLERIRIQGSSS